PFTKDTVREIIQNRFYVGELPDGNGGWVPGKHGVLIDPDLFERAQQARLRNVKRPRRVRTERRSPWALSGLATCAECGRSLTAYGRSDGKQRVQCSGRTQGHGCDAPTFYAHLVEDQLGTFLGQHFAVPPQERDRLVRAWRLGQDRTTDTAAERERLRRKLERRKALFLEGDLDQASYRAQKAELQTQLAGLPSEGRTGDGVGRRLADYLADVALAWQAGTPEERNKLARELFGEVVVDNRTAVAVAPRPDLLPFFQAVACQPGDDLTYGRKRRGSLAR
ncbi:MAG: recombinase family protein, partial [Chloroflexota bacterium]|nr:recombinase family protein [Chloroflexota bacterium]